MKAQVELVGIGHKKLALNFNLKSLDLSCRF